MRIPEYLSEYLSVESVESVGFVEEVTSGWSKDKKYHVVGKNGMEYMLRISSAAGYEEKAELFTAMKVLSAQGIDMCEPVELQCDEQNVYFLQSWVKGIDLETGISGASAEVQYGYGLQAGAALKRIHALRAPENREAWGSWFNRKMDSKIRSYEECHLKVDGGETMIDTSMRIAD